MSMSWDFNLNSVGTMSVECHSDIGSINDGSWFWRRPYNEAAWVLILLGPRD